MSGLFITGTDTDVGKTLCAVAIIKKLAATTQQRIAVMKPVSAGAQLTEQGLRNEDALLLSAVSTVQAPYEIINPYCFAPAIAPHIAAAQQNVEISIEHIHGCYQQLVQQSDIVIVEGAGGWHVPLNASQRLSDLAILLALPVVVVVNIKLGCLNHSLLTIEAIRNSKLPIFGWIANITHPEKTYQQENISYLQSSLTFPLLGVIPYLNKLQQREQADQYLQLPELL